jgi:hypothetical protein
MYNQLRTAALVKIGGGNDVDGATRKLSEFRRHKSI